MLNNITLECLKTDFEEKSEQLMKMLLQGHKLSEISEALDVPAEDVYKLADMIGERRKKYV